MRLVRLRIKNIASLKGEHTVNFETIQSHSPLFAITGETGAGKSSVLNAIGLALYGQIYKKNVTQVDVVTLGEKDGEIQLIFQVSGKSYLADWKAKVRKQSGELLKQPLIQRQVFPIDGNDFESNRQEPIDSVDRLLNLDFDQFCKCIILNQGEFARFLSSSFTERKDILEKLYPGELLDNLGKELRGQLDTLDREKSDLDIKLGELKGEPLNGENLIQEKERLKHELSLFESWSKTIEGLESSFVSLASHHTKYHENKKKSDAIRSDLKSATTSFNEVLKSHETIHERYLSSKKKHEKEFPRLQELLKTEEALKHCVELKVSSEKKIEILKRQLNTLEKGLSENNSRIIKWEDTHTSLGQGLKFPVQDLKANREKIEVILDLFTESLNHKKEQKNIEDKLAELELLGKEVNQQFTSVGIKLKEFPLDLKEGLALAESKKSELAKSTELRQKSELLDQELKKQLAQHKKELAFIDEKLNTSLSSLVIYEQEFTSLDTTIKLQELTSAIEICLTHVTDAKVETCPVCTSVIPTEKWDQLLGNISKADIVRVKARSYEISRLIIQIQEENKIAQAQKQNLEEAIRLKTKELTLIEISLKGPLPSLIELEEKIKRLHKNIWDYENLKNEELRLNTDLARARDQYARSKLIRQEIVDKLSLLENTLEEKVAQTDQLLTYPPTQTIMDSLRDNFRLLTQFIASEAIGDKLKQERSFMHKDQTTRTQEHTEAMQDLSLLINKMDTYQARLTTELAGKSAHELIETSNREVKELHEKAVKSDKDLKQHELTLKEYQSKLYGLDEQLKEYDMLFVKELHSIREASSVAMPEIKIELSGLTLRLKTLDLDFTSPSELFTPIKDLLTQEKETLKEETNKLRETHASVNQRLQDWEKRQDKILVFEMTRSDIQLKLNRLQRLFEVLGKDELRSFVLSLVEENLIIQTNEELLKLCQGRYEILHQSRGKRDTPEFYILDKFREGGKRKVSTLSGGETFMVSLAMALALAEMTRGQAEIDSLFIDEGFGTLDQESLEDVLDMLNQIQNRGLMVGIISHIKTLTDAIPVNLLLSKKQDGTSTISIQAN
ncbi:MAG TPA: SMC family ATPase [Bacteriovoracaceae bacterium]|nr:SMC family ATPase [Bacteriovoracaceae bacterium]